MGLNQHQRKRNRRRREAKAPKPEVFYGEQVGLIMGVVTNGIPRLSSTVNWARNVPKAYRRPSKARRIV